MIFVAIFLLAIFMLFVYPPIGMFLFGFLFVCLMIKLTISALWHILGYHKKYPND